MEGNKMEQLIEKIKEIDLENLSDLDVLDVHKGMDVLIKEHQTISIDELKAIANLNSWWKHGHVNYDWQAITNGINKIINV